MRRSEDDMLGGSNGLMSDNKSVGSYTPFVSVNNSKK